MSIMTSKRMSGINMIIALIFVGQNVKTLFEVIAFKKLIKQTPISLLLVSNK